MTSEYISVGVRTTLVECLIGFAGDQGRAGVLLVFLGMGQAVGLGSRGFLSLSKCLYSLCHSWDILAYFHTAFIFYLDII